MGGATGDKEGSGESQVAQDSFVVDRLSITCQACTKKEVRKSLARFEMFAMNLHYTRHHFDVRVEHQNG